jgi:hypothetical protein
MFLAGIKAVFLDSGLKNAGMTSRCSGHFIVRHCTKYTIRNLHFFNHEGHEDYEKMHRDYCEAFLRVLRGELLIKVPSQGAGAN